MKIKNFQRICENKMNEKQLEEINYKSAKQIEVLENIRRDTMYIAWLLGIVLVLLIAILIKMIN